MERDEDTIIGVTVERAAQLVGVSVSQLAAWEGSGLIRPQVHRELAGRHIRIYGLPELLDACIVAQLVGRGVSAGHVRNVVEFHRSESVKHPLRQLKWAVDGGKIYVMDDAGHWFGGRNPGQGVIPEVIDLEWLRATLRALAVARSDMCVGRIERRPRTHRKRPVLAGTRTPVAAVRAYLERGIDDSEILEAFPHLRQADIDAVRNAVA